MNRSLKSELRFRVHEILAAKGIELPFPQRDLHIRSATGLEKLMAERRPPADANGSGGMESAPHPQGR